MSLRVSYLKRSNRSLKLGAFKNMAKRGDPRIASALDGFLRRLTAPDLYDLIVPVERKGTALVRAALHGCPTARWKCVLSSDAIQDHANKVSPKKILILDDSVWTGLSLRRTVATVAAAFPNAAITTAAFVTHRDAPPDLVNIAYYQSVDELMYQTCRDTLVNFLQDRG